MRPVRRGAHCSVTPAAARVRNRDAAEDLDTGCAGMTSRFAGPPMIRALAAGGASWEDGREEACRERLPGGHAVSHRERSRGGADHAAVTRTSARPFRELGLAVLEIEARAVAALAARIDGAFERACELKLGCEGRIVVLGMGKSGHIGRKLAAPLASAGSPAVFVH